MSRLSLWESVLEIYSIASMETVCLELQDKHNARVTFLLWAIWLDNNGYDFDADFWLDTYRKVGCRNAAVVAIRAVRRRLPKSGMNLYLREKIKRLELRNEKKILEKLEKLTLNSSVISTETGQSTTHPYLENYLQELEQKTYFMKIIRIINNGG
jgi:uncharacterized protein (TIGR02444 family)